MKKKCVLITGGMGFIGKHIALQFMENGYEPVLFDVAATDTDMLESKKGQWRFVMGGVEDWPKVLDNVRSHEVEGIVHCALPPLAGSGETTKTNFDGCHNLLSVCRLEKLKFVYTSSNAAYGYRPDGNPLLETDRAPMYEGARAALYEYGAMKQICESLTSMYHAVHGVDTVSVRFGWVWGPGTRRWWYPQWFLANALAGVPAILDEGGDHKADYTYVKDAARGVYLAFTVRPLKHRLYNITSGRKVTAQEVVETVKKVVPGANIKIGPGMMKKGLGNPAVHPVQTGPMLVTQAVEELGYTTTSLEQALRETAEWFRTLPKIPSAPDPN